MKLLIKYINGKTYVRDNVEVLEQDDNIILWETETKSGEISMTGVKIIKLDDKVIYQLAWESKK